MQRNKLSTAEAGIASIVVTIIMMVVISLIVVGFAQVARRNSREAVDKQLSAQAYYAAEAGVNDVTSIIRAAAQNGSSVLAKQQCQGGSGYGSLNPVLDAGGDVSYSCLLVDPNPKSLIYTSVKEGLSTVVPIELSGTTNLKTLTLQWSSDGQAQNPTTCNNGSLTLPKAADWKCNFAILRVDATKIESTGTNPDNLNAVTSTFYLKPFTSATPLTITPAFEKAYIANSSCPTTGSKCTATINIAGTAQGTRYFLRLTGLYKDARNVTITGTDTNSVAVSFKNAQVLVDSTGKAQDQLRRISVRVPVGVTNSNTLPSNSLQTAGDICKRFTTGPAPLVTNTNQCQGY